MENNITSVKGLIPYLRDKLTALNLKVSCFPDGNVRSDIAFVGDFPREREQALGRPFTGELGGKLWATVKRHVPNISRTNVYMTHGIKRRVYEQKKGNKKTLDIGSNEIASWESVMQWELDLLPNLNYVVVFGELALQAVLGETKIKNWRGSVVPKKLKSGKEIQVLIVDSPLTGIRQAKEEVVFDFFLSKLKKLYSGDYKEHKIDYIINPTFAEAFEYIEHIHNEPKPIAYDIEVISNETACVGFANREDEGICINFRDFKFNVFSVDEEYKLRMRMQKLFEDPKVKLVAQNGNFDAMWLWYKDRIKVRRNWFDTLLAHHTLYNALPHNLGFITAQYTDLPFYKDEGKTWAEGGDIDQFWKYNIKDCVATLIGQRKIERELQEQHMDEFFFNHVMRVQPHLTESTVNGILVDYSLKDKIAEETLEIVNGLLENINDQARICTGDSDYKVKPSSPTQLKRMFFIDLQLIGRGSSTDADNRKRIRNHPNTNEDARKLIDYIDEFQTENKFLTTYANMEIDEDQRFRSEYKQYGVETAPGRLSSAAPLWGTGGNAQNLPDRTNPMFIAPDGYCYVYFDLAQAEARIVGYKAKIDKWKEDFERARLDGSFDCHRSLAADMWKIPYDDIPIYDKDEKGFPTLRYKAKRCRHGLNYGMDYGTLATQTNMTLFEAQDNYNIYHRTNPEIRTWWAAVRKEMQTKKMLFNAYGRRLMLLSKFDERDLLTYVAFYPQSTIGDKVQEVWYQSEDDDAWPHDARIVRNVHDALYALCKIKDRFTVAKIMKKHAESPLTIEGEQLIIPADLKISVAGDDGIHRFSTLKGIEL